MMTAKSTLIVDLGNTQVKIAEFVNGKLSILKRVGWTELMDGEELQHFFEKKSGFFSSVLSSEQNLAFKLRFPTMKMFDSNIKLMLQMDYSTPHTLGKDRICNAVGAWSKNNNANSLVIDVGTCIKYDLVTKDGIYRGGAISPGMRLRYQSLNDYTANLPLVDDKSEANLVGKSTKEAIHSGVINGMKAEMLHLIQEYENIYESLTIFVTGGDAKYFDLEVKNNIFVSDNLTLEGLYQIYLFNV